MMRYTNLTILISLLLFLSLTIGSVPLAAQDVEYRDSIVRRVDTVYYSVTDTQTVYTSISDSAIVYDTILISPDTIVQGFYLQGYIGAGYGTLGHSVAQGSVTGSFTGIVELRYAYLFHKNWGVGVGLNFENYTSNTTVTGKRQWNSVERKVSDSEGEIYNHTTYINEWVEHETDYRLGVPVMLQFIYPFKKSDNNLKLFADLGIEASFHVAGKYKVRSSSLTHEGYYSPWGLTLHDIHEFRTHSPKYNGDFKTKTSVGALADIGILIPLKSLLDLYVGVYANVQCNDVYAGKGKELGFQNNDLYKFKFMETYDGMLATNECGSVCPWAVGIKVGIHWHQLRRPYRQPTEEINYFTRIDTTYNYITRIDSIFNVREDTLHIPLPVHYKTHRLTQSNYSVLFGFDKATLNKEMDKMLTEIGRSLIDYPDQRIAIYGHTCDIGNSEYNQKLSERRAQMVYEHLMNMGVEAKQIEVRGFGYERPADVNPQHDKANDRRVEIIVIKDEEVEQ